MQVLEDAAPVRVETIAVRCVPWSGALRADLGQRDAPAGERLAVPDCTCGSRRPGTASRSPAGA
ncbi:MAG: hypothetical protein AAFR54_22680, partial [Planctomycetota bacterium]